MRCEEVQGLFSEIYDGVAENQPILAKHLLNCPACAAEYESYSQLLDDVRFLPEPELPEGFHDTMMSKIREIAPPTDQTIDELLDSIEARNRLKEARRTKRPARSGAAITRRWAGVAAAACLLLMTMWAMQTFQLPTRYSDMTSATNEAMPPAPAAQAAEPPMTALPRADSAEYSVLAEAEYGYHAWAAPEAAMEGDYVDYAEEEGRMGMFEDLGSDDIADTDEAAPEVFTAAGQPPQDAPQDVDVTQRDTWTDAATGAGHPPGMTDGAPAQDYTQTQGLTGGSSIILTIASVGSLVVLLIALGGVAWSIHNNTKAKKG